MAALIHLLILAAIACPALQLEASQISPATATRLGAWRALEKCDRLRAPYWAAELERLDPAQALLYKLAWLDAPAEFTPLASIRSKPLSQELAWKTATEIWADEEALSPHSCVPEPADARAEKTYSRLPQSVTQNLLEPMLGSYASHPPALRETLRDFALFEWMQGRRLGLDTALLPPSAAPQESCDWRALRALHAVPEDAAAVRNSARDCILTRAATRTSATLLWAIVQTRAGDLFLHEGRTDLAFRSFEAAIGLIPENAMPKALHYRLAISGLLSGAPDDVVLRAANSALAVDENGKTDELAAPLRSSLGNLVCERLSVMRTRDTLTTFDKVFTAEALVPGALRLTETCARDSALAPLWSAVLAKARTMGERSRLIGRLLIGAVAHRDFASADKSARRLAEISRKSAHLASRTFWSALEQAGADLHTEPLQKLIKTYRRHATAIPSDDLKLKRLARKDSKDAHAASTVLIAQAHVDSKTVKLPMAVLAEPMTIEADVRTDFIPRVKSELLK